MNAATATAEPATDLPIGRAWRIAPRPADRRDPFSNVAVIDTSYSTVDLLGARINASAPHAAESATASVLSVISYHRRLANAEFAKRLPRACPKGLPEFGSVNLGKSHLYLTAINEDRQGIPVVDRNNLAAKEKRACKRGGVHIRSLAASA